MKEPWEKQLDRHERASHNARLARDEIHFVPRKEGESYHVVAARLRLMREALRTSGIGDAAKWMDKAESDAIELLADPDSERNYREAEATISWIERMFEAPTRKLTTCVNGHRSTVPIDAVAASGASTYCCPECGKGVGL